jgi:cardiolipin synthase
MDIRSFSINYEVNAVLYDAQFSQRLAQDFLADQQDCVEFSLHEYERRHLLVRLRDSVARLFSPML